MVATSINFKTDPQKQFIKKVKNHRMAFDLKLVMDRAPTRSEIWTFGPNSDHFGKWSENGPNLGFFCKMVRKCSDSVTAI